MLYLLPDTIYAEGREEEGGKRENEIERERVVLESLMI